MIVLTREDWIKRLIEPGRGKKRVEQMIKREGWKFACDECSVEYPVLMELGMDINEENPAWVCSPCLFKAFQMIEGD